MGVVIASNEHIRLEINTLYLSGANNNAVTLVKRLSHPSFILQQWVWICMSITCRYSNANETETIPIAIQLLPQLSMIIVSVHAEKLPLVPFETFAREWEHNENQIIPKRYKSRR